LRKKTAIKNNKHLADIFQKFQKLPQTTFLKYVRKKKKRIFKRQYD